MFNYRIHALHTLGGERNLIHPCFCNLIRNVLRINIWDRICRLPGIRLSVRCESLHHATVTQRPLVLLQPCIPQISLHTYLFPGWTVCGKNREVWYVDTSRYDLRRLHHQADYHQGLGLWRLVRRPGVKESRWHKVTGPQFSPWPSCTSSLIQLWLSAQYIGVCSDGHTVYLPFHSIYVVQNKKGDIFSR